MFWSYSNIMVYMVMYTRIELDYDETCPPLRKTKERMMAKRLPNHLSISTNPETGQDEYYCTPCKRAFRSRTQKYYHYNCNDGAQKKYKCEQCEQSFSTRSHLNYHLEAHQDKTYKCAECSKVFSNRLVFEKHKKLHQRKNLFDCSFCQKRFRSRETLTAHKARHANELKFECSDCVKKYATKSALEQHKLKHSAKKHKCPHCGKHFQRNSILNVHLKRHSPNEFFVCITCLKKFSDSGALNRHSKTHRSEEIVKYRCKKCHIITVRKDNIQRHVRNMHNGESFTNCVEILTPTQQTVAVNQKDEEMSKKLLENNDQNVPKTVANSSVIKFVGNVEPVVIAVPQGTKISEHETAETEVRTFAVLEPVKNVDAKKKYDPIEMYRKILNSDERDEQSDHINHHDTPDRCEPVMTKRSSNFANSNFSAVHWRNYFKHTYTQHQGY